MVKRSFVVRPTQPMSTNPSFSELVIPATDIVMVILPASGTTLSNRVHTNSVQEISIYSSQNVAPHGIHTAEIWLKVQLMIALHTVHLKSIKFQWN